MNALSARTSEMLEHDSLENAVASARQLEKSGNLDGAVAAWKQVCTRYPQHSLGYSGCGAALRQLRRDEEAEFVLLEGRSKFPSDESIAREHGWVAHSRGDWPEAHRRWTLLRAICPESFGGYYGGGAALRAMGRYDEADVVYLDAFKRWPNASNLLADYAASAQARGDFDEAARRWRVLRDRYPDEHDSYLQQIKALLNVGYFDRADAIAAEAAARFPGNSAIMIEYAQIAQRRGMPAEALKRWDEVATAFPGLAEGHVGAADALNDLGRYADAETVLQPALRMFPDAPHIATLNAWIAHYQRNYSEALSRWSKLRERFPNLLASYGGKIATFLTMGKLPEATAEVEQALRLFPNDMHIAMDHARIARHAQDWNEAERRWASLNQRFGHDATVKVNYAQSLTKNNKTAEADELLEAAIAANESDVTLLRCYAECATQRMDWIAAESRWRSLVDRFPERSTGWGGLAEAYRAQGRLDESHQTLSAALQKFPGSVELEVQQALTQTLRRDWPVALKLWETLKLKYPRRGDVTSGITQALWQARQDLGVAASEGGVAPFEIPAGLLQSEDLGGSDNAALCGLFMKFESIGDTCEFGIVQRRFGAEPISLLRWSGISPANLVRALAEKFEGIGDPANTIIAASSGEYTSRDTRYQIFSHTFTPETAERLDKFTAQHLRRMKFLSRKLVADLAAGEKILVYKCTQGLSDLEARSIFEGIRRYGGYTALLCMRLKDELHATGFLEELDDGLFVGYIDRFSTVDINVDVWVDICRKVEATWSAKVQQRAAPAH